MSQYIMDAGPLIALMNRNDAYHEWAVELFEDLPGPWKVCEPVIAEVCALTQRPLDVLREFERGVFEMAFVLDDHRKRVVELLTSYQDQGMDLADACVVRMSEIFDDHTVITVDRTDFKVYRKNRRDVISFRAPPE